MLQFLECDSSTLPQLNILQSCHGIGDRLAVHDTVNVALSYDLKSSVVIGSQNVMYITQKVRYITTVQDRDEISLSRFSRNKSEPATLSPAKPSLGRPLLN